MTIKVAILDYSIGNIYSVEKAFKYIGAEPILVTTSQEILTADRLVVPGVGAFGKCIKTLEQLNLVDPLLEFLKKGRPFLGICVGMQLLMSKSFEEGEFNGLGVISGKVQPIPTAWNGNKLKVPHIGWRSINNLPDGQLFKHINPCETFYFVHSYHSNVDDGSVTLCQADYEGYPVTAYVEKDHVFGCQFHPEKSRGSGLTLLKNFMNI
jgi:imidazole glycerol-phosphate synthase subunit HisH